MLEIPKNVLLKMETVQNIFLVCGGFTAGAVKYYIQKYRIAYIHINITTNQQLRLLLAINVIISLAIIKLYIVGKIYKTHPLCLYFFY